MVNWGYYLLCVNVIGFVLLFVNTRLCSNNAQKLVHGFLMVLAVLGGALSILTAILIFDRKAVKSNMMLRVFVICILVIQVVGVLFFRGIHGDRITFAFWEFFAQHKIFLIYLGMINIFTFVLFGIDKIAAIKKRSRIKIVTLLGLCFAGGSVGGLVAMYLFHHKTRKDYFKAGVPLIIFTQIIVLLYFMNL